MTLEYMDQVQKACDAFDEEVKDLLEINGNKSLRTMIKDCMDTGAYIKKIKSTLKAVSGLEAQGIIVK